MKKERPVCARRRVGEAAGPEGRARRPKVRRSNGSASAAESFMANAGEAERHIALHALPLSLLG